MFSDGLMARFREIVDLQKECLSKFGEEDYNVFIFGSYLTERYVSGKSDIDIAIYSRDFKKYLDVALFFEDHFNKKGIKQDIFPVDLEIVSPIFCAPLSSPVRFTDFYPEELKEFFDKCELKKEKNKETLYANQAINRTPQRT